MRRTKEVALEGAVFTVKELTIAEIRTLYFQENEAPQTDEFAAILGSNLHMDDGVSLGDLAFLCSVKVTDFDGYTQNELQPLVEAGKELNPGFFALKAALQVQFLKELTQALPSGKQNAENS